MTSKTLALVVALCSISSLNLLATDWAQYRGPNHDGASPEKILKVWPANGPRQIWKVPMTDGFSAITVGGGKAFTLELRDIEGAKQEVCVGIDAGTGKELWAVPLGIAKYDGGGDSGTPDNSGGDGPRSTPSYDDGKVYTCSSRLVLKCLNAADGKELWASDLIKDHAGRNIRWQCGASPLIEGDLVFVAGGGPGESLLAFDKKDGHVVWKGQDELMTQSTPVATTILGTRQVIFFTQSGLVSVAPATGSVLWRYPFKFRVATAMSPVVSGDIVYCSAGYGVGSGACKITKSGDTFTATQLWFQPANVIANHWSTPVCADGYIYGLFGHAQYGKAPLKCVDLATGEVKWSKEGFGPGGCTLVDGHVLVLSDAGDLVLVKTNPAAYTEVARSHVLSGKCWNCVAISNGRIYARSTKEGVCLDVSPKMANR